MTGVTMEQCCCYMNSRSSKIMSYKLRPRHPLNPEQETSVHSASGTDASAGMANMPVLRRRFPYVTHSMEVIKVGYVKPCFLMWIV